VYETLEGIRAISPPLLVAILGMLLLVLDLGPSTPQRRRSLPFVGIVGLLITAGIAYAATAGQVMVAADVEPITTYFGRGMVADDFGGGFCIVLCLVAAMAIGMAPRYLEEKGLNHGEFYALLLFSTCGAMLMALSFDLVNVFIGLEVLSVSLYILSGYARRDQRSEESGMKYFLLGAFASGFLVYGVALIDGAVGLTVRSLGVVTDGTSFTNFYIIGQALRESAGSASPLVGSPLFVTGVAFVIVGLSFKAAIVPFHAYAPDVYEGAPTPVTAFMSAAAKIGAFAAFVRLFHQLLNAQGSEPFLLILGVLAAATIIVGNVLAVRQTNIKRMLAYSSIAHAGYILVGVMATGIPAASDYARQAVLYYLFVYSFMNLGAFAVVLWLGRDGGEYLDIRDYAGLARKHPLAAAVLAVFMLSLAGIPPTAGFMGKLYLFMAAIQADMTGLAVLGLVASAIGVFYYLNIVVMMYFQSGREEIEAPREGGAKITAVLAAVAIIVLGIFPGVLPFLSPRPNPKDVPTPFERRIRPVLAPPPSAAAAPASRT
jgi:NADH-quinone oxidoreductase subunit N